VGDALPLIGADGHVRPMETLETEALRFAIFRYRGRMSEVARRLGIGRSTLYRKLKDLGLDADTESAEEHATDTGAARA
jgi:DNA-binding NtrC family response regulator